MARTAEHSNLQVAGTVLLALTTVFVGASIFTYSPADWPSPKVFPHNSPAANACGAVGAWMAHQLFTAIGPATYMLLVCLGVVFVSRTLRGGVPNPAQRAFGAVCVIAAVATAGHLWLPLSRATPAEGNGGLLGIVLGDLMETRLSGIGSAIVLFYVLLIGMLFAGEGLLFRVPGVINAIGGVGRAARAVATQVPAVVFAGRRRAAKAGKPDEEEEDDESEADDEEPAESERRAAKLQKVEPKIKPQHIEPKKSGRRRDPGESAGVTVAEQAALFDEPERDAAALPAKGKPADEKPSRTSDDAPVSEAAPAKSSPAALPTVRPMPKLAPARAEPPRPYPSPLSDWQPPSIDLLSEPSYHFGREQEKAVREKATVLEQTLSEYRIEANVVEIDPGPAITLYEVQLAPGVKVSQIHALSNDISRALKAPMIRVISPIPGKNTIGIEVPNADREIVRLRELIAAAGSHTQQMTLPLYLGKDSSGNPLVSDLARMPHMLVAGTTGSGKSICLNTIILSLLMTQRPDVVKLILVDPKMVELSVFRSIPHLMCPIVTEVKRAAAILDWAVTTMEERYEILAEGGVRNIAAFNRLGAAEIYRRFNPDTDDEKARIPLHLPHIIIVIDELADMMMTCGKEVELYLARLAQKSRAVGIHIIVATQRPEAKIVTGLIKSNLPCRIAFRVASRLDSRIVLDQNGAELLLGQGDMLFLPPGSSRLIRSQGTYVDDVELKRVLDDLAARSKPEFHPDLVKMPGDGGDGDSGERDELFDAAVRVVLESGRGSVSLLQRKLTIGYSRASRLVEQMAAVGVVGDYKGSQAREVIMTLEEWEAMCGSGVASGSAVMDVEKSLDDHRPYALSDEANPVVTSAKDDDDDDAAKDDDDAADDDADDEEDWDDEFDDDLDVDDDDEEEAAEEEEMSVRQPPSAAPGTID